MRSIGLSSFNDLIHSAFFGAKSIFRDAETQWMIVFCLTCYFLLVLFVGRRLLGGNNRLRFNDPDVWLAATVMLVLLRYAFAYDGVSGTTQVPVVLTGILCGIAIRTWTNWPHNSAERKRRAFSLPMLLVCFLSGVVVWNPRGTAQFQYHGASRWNGIWSNPNMFGLWMGTGFVLAVGQILGTRRLKAKNGKWRKILCAMLCSIGAIVCSIGLFKSYSRGAWVGAGIGIMYLLTAWISRPRSGNGIIWVKRNWKFLLLIVLSAGVLTFWQLRFSKWRPIQRVVSIANPNDFSWRNRVLAWEGAIRMMIHRPFTGFGWGQAEEAYQQKFLPPQLTDGAAIQLNDYFTLGISAGVSVLLCFIAYIWFTLRPKPEPPSSAIQSPFSIYTVCRAGTLVLLVGFWFDGGLFRLSVGPVFWTLMELSRLEPSAGAEATKPTSKIGKRESEVGNPSATPHVVSSGKKEIWLRRAAWTLGTFALLQTTVYLSAPFFPVSKATLAIARKCLIPSKEIADFNFLATNVDWRGKPLRILLQHANLANYNRRLVNWTLDDKIYRDYVLNPTVEPNRDGQMHWRRALWENLYPRIRHATDPAAAARTVLQQLQERVKRVSSGPLTIGEMWWQKTADAKGVEALRVAAWRSVGIPARLGADGRAEMFSNGRWQTISEP